MALLGIRTKADVPNVAGNQLVIIVDGDDFEELTSMKTRGQVLSFARSLGFNGSGLASVPHPYPVDKDGKTDPKMLTDPANNKWDHWQAEYEINAGLR